MLLLPLFNAKLHPCPVSTAAFAPHPQGNFCGQCQRVVHDFSQSTAPRADLAAARAAAPDGRVCGRFGAAQVQAAPTLSRRLRWFVAALMLVVAQGLTAREALAQVRRAIPTHRPRPTAAPKQAANLPVSTQTVVSDDFIDGIVMEGPRDPDETLYTYVQQMPTFQGGDMATLLAYIQGQVQWPKGTRAANAKGRLFVSFTVDKNGMVRDAKVAKGLHPLLDAEALRVVRELPAFAPGKQNGQAVAVTMTVPIFKRD